MLKTYLYIPDELNNKIISYAKNQKKSKAEVMRQAMEEGLKSQVANNGAQVLRGLMEFAKKHKVKGPRDLSVNHDYYLWGLPKKDPRIKP